MQLSDGSWRCRNCGDDHHGLAWSFGTDAPLTWQVTTQADRDAGELTNDQCVVTLDGVVSYYVRANIELEVVDAPGRIFSWSVWISLSEASMTIVHENWNNPDRASMETRFGWVNTMLPYEQPTVGLASMMHSREPGKVGYLHLDPSADHLLVHEQLNGITIHRVAELNELSARG